MHFEGGGDEEAAWASIYKTWRQIHPKNRISPHPRPAVLQHIIDNFAWIRKTPTSPYHCELTLPPREKKTRWCSATSQRPLIFVCTEQPKATEQCLKPPDLFLAVQCFEIWIANGFHANPRSSYASWWLLVWFESASMLSIFVCVVGGKLRLLGVHETHQRHIAGTGVVLWPPQGNALTQCEPLFFPPSKHPCIR